VKPFHFSAVSLATTKQPVYGVVLLPDTATCTRLEALSKKAQLTWNGTFQLDRTHGPHPHLSVFHLVILDKDLPRLLAAFGRLALGPTAIHGHCHEVLMKPGGWLFVQADGQRLLEIQNQVLQEIAPLRSEDIDIDWIDQMTPLQREMYHRYGYPNVGDAWDIHFTVSKAAGDMQADKTTLNKSLDWRWQAKELAIVRIGEYGTATEILHSINVE